MMANCPECGRQLRELAERCPECGADLTDLQASTSLSPSRDKRHIVLIALSVIVLGGLIFAGLGYKTFREMREIDNTSHCRNHLAQIGRALENYHDEFGVFPPAYVSDQHGRPMHSWRVLILPYFDSSNLKNIYQQYDLSEPWDGPHNVKLLSKRPDVYACPSGSADNPTLTAYAAIVGDECVFRGTKPVRAAEITDGLENTIIIGEVSRQRIRWTEPRDISFGAFPGVGQPEGFSGVHEGGVYLLNADGSVIRVSEDTPLFKIRAWFTRAGGEQVDPGF